MMLSRTAIRRAALACTRQTQGAAQPTSVQQPFRLTERLFSSTPRTHADFTHVVIGGGVVGLAIARKLSERAGASTLLVEKHGSAGMETSSRNSEVIHAGLYYGADSLKTRLCLEGKRLLYETCIKHGIAHRNCGKWLVAQDDAQMAELAKVHDFAASIGVPTHWVGRAEAADREPDVRARAGVLESPSTGIVDSHGLMAWLEGQIQANGGDLAYHTAVTRIEREPDGSYAVGTRDGSAGDDGESVITAEVVVNSAGLYATEINNMLLPEDRHVTPYYAKGTYFSYAAARPKPRTLVYPAPQPGHGGLGTHLTLDLSDPPRVRFGPDVEWVDSPTDYTPNPTRLKDALDDIQEYLPGLERDKIEVDYCGIRPKLGKMSAVGSGKGFQDFIIRKEEGFDGFVNLLGIESPGLTSSLAIADEVETLLYK